MFLHIEHGLFVHVVLWDTETSGLSVQFKGKETCRHHKCLDMEHYVRDF